jgi:hypothetical protein
MKVYELIVLLVLLAVIWPTLVRIIKALTVWLLSHFGEQGYPVKYTDVRGQTTTLYLKTVQEVTEFSENPHRYIKQHGELIH